MDTVMIEKLHAMKMYKRRSSRLSRPVALLHTLVQYTLATLLFGLFLSCPLWVPWICSSARSFLFVSLPSVRITNIFGPGCIFLVCNVIVAVLVGQSRSLVAPVGPVADIYEEYYHARRNRSVKRVVEMEVDGGFHGGDHHQESVEEDVQVGEDDQAAVEVGGEVEEEGGVEEEEEEEEGEGGREEEEEEDSSALPAEELNKRVEDFIARVNHQRRLEAKMLVCCRG